MSDKADFVRRTNDDYAEWCRAFYVPDVLDECGMRSLHGLWAWQAQERRIEAMQAENEELRRKLEEMTR